MFNKVVKDLWHKTSGRKATECHELMKQDLLRSLISYHDDKVSLINRRYCSETLLSSEDVPINTEFKCSVREKKSELSFDITIPVFKISGAISSDHFKKFSINSDAFNLQMSIFFQEQNFNPADNFKLILRNRVTIVGNKESSLGTVLLHAYSNGGSNGSVTAWYDFVLIQGRGGKQFLAQIMGIFEIVDETGDKSSFCFFVKYLEEVNQKEHSGSSQNRSDFVSLKNIYNEYRWAAGTGTNRYDIGVVLEDCIADIAFVVPSFNNNSSTDVKSNHRDDRFYFIHRKFFDRSGWTFEQNDPSSQQLKSSSRVSSKSFLCTGDGGGSSSSSSIVSAQYQNGTETYLGRNFSDDVDRLVAYLDQEGDGVGQPISDFTAEYIFEEGNC